MKRALRGLTAITAAGVLLGTTAATAGTPPFPGQYAAPYLQIEAADAGDMAADMQATGERYYTLAFLTPAGGCTPIWEDNNDPMNAFTSQVAALQSAGGNVIPSFGGASGGELARTCAPASRLESAYAQVADTYQVHRLDFDIEGGVLDSVGANHRRDRALAALQAARPSLQIDFTLPVNPDGLPSDAMAMLRDALQAGVEVNLVNIMTMDFGDGQNPLKDAETAARGTAKQLAGLYGISTTAAYGMIGLTPIAGQNDDQEFFSTADARVLERFAARHGIQELSFWEVDGYDKPAGFAYSRIFNRITREAGGSASWPRRTAGVTIRR
jgi:chitinase